MKTSLAGAVNLVLVAVIPKLWGYGAAALGTLRVALTHPKAAAARLYPPGQNAAGQLAGCNPIHLTTSILHVWTPNLWFKSFLCTSRSHPWAHENKKMFKYLQSQQKEIVAEATKPSCKSYWEIINTDFPRKVCTSEGCDSFYTFSHARETSKCSRYHLNTVLYKTASLQTLWCSRGKELWSEIFPTQKECRYHRISVPYGFWTVY